MKPHLGLIGAVLWLLFLFFGAGCIAAYFLHYKTNAMEIREVKPYVFTELPHGRIYKAVHEGCELYIVENDVDSVANQKGDYQHFYQVTAGRGCK